MPPKAKPAAKAAPKWSAASNARGMRRRAAVALLNGLAEEVFVKQVRRKAPAGTVERLVRLLETRCQDGGLPGRLRAAAAAYLDNGGCFPTPLLPAAAAAEGAEPCDGDGDPPPTVDAPPFVGARFPLEVEGVHDGLQQRRLLRSDVADLSAMGSRHAP